MIWRREVVMLDRVFQRCLCLCQSPGRSIGIYSVRVKEACRPYIMTRNVLQYFWAEIAEIGFVVLYLDLHSGAGTE